MGTGWKKFYCTPYTENNVFVLGQNKRNKFVSHSVRAFYFLPQIYIRGLPHLQFLFGLSQKAKSNCLFWGSIRQDLCEKLKIFPWNLFSCLNNDQFQCIWAVKYTSMSFAFEILTSNIKISLQCPNKSLKDKKLKKTLFSFKFFDLLRETNLFFYFGLINN